MRKLRLLQLVAVVMTCCMITAGCGSSGTATKDTSNNTSNQPATDESKETEESTVPSSPVKISLGTASVGGNYYVLGAGLAGILNEHIPEYVSVTAEATGGSGANVGLVQNGDCDVAFTVENTAYNGYNGLSWADGEMYSDIRTFFAMMPSALEIVATKSSKIESLDQLKDAVVTIGPATSGGNLAFVEFQSVLGLEYKSKVDLGWSDAINNMCDGVIDVCIDYGTFPHSARSELTTNTECVWLSLTDEQIQQVCDAYPYYYAGIEPAGTYKYMDEDYPSVLCNNIMFGNVSVDEETVYQIVKCTFENLDEWKLSSDSVKYVAAESIKTCSVPLHLGAIRYFEEIGIEIPESLYPPEYKG